MSIEPRYSMDGPEKTSRYALNLLLICGSIWFITVLLVIIFVLGTLI